MCEICMFLLVKCDFYWCVSIVFIVVNGEFFLFFGMERIVMLLEGGEMFFESVDCFNYILKLF